MVVVLKFGGSSISNNGFETILEQIKSNKSKKIIVLSAMYNITNQLLNLVDTKNLDIIDEISDKYYIFIDSLKLERSIVDDLVKNLREDSLNISKQNIPKIVSYGEKFTTLILSKYLESRGYKNKLLAGYDIIKTNNNFSDMDNNIHMKGEFFCDSSISKEIENEDILITQGFVAMTNDNYICTLTRGGSDTTASLIAAKLEAEKLEIWTDVNGIYNADPNIIDYANIIRDIDYELCQEMAGMGAKVLHPFCIKPCMKKNIPIFIKNTYNSNNVNTKISNQFNDHMSLMIDKNNQVFNISSLNMWNDYGFVADIFSKFKKYSIDINIITTSQYSVLATTKAATKEVNDIKLKNLKEELEESYDVSLFNCDIISVIGRNMLQNKNIPKLFDKLNNHSKIHITHFSSNNMCLSFAIDSEISEVMYKNIYDILFKRENKVEDLNSKWWYKKLNDVKQIGAKDSVYLYDLKNVISKCNSLSNNLDSIGKFYYAMKANNNLDILKTINNCNFGFECVSIDEVRYIRKHFPDANVLFTPNYCDVKEYEQAFNFDCVVIVDNMQVVKDNIKIFESKEIGVRLDLNLGEGHNKKVVTEGVGSKFGLPVDEISELMNLTNKSNIKIVGLHSHRGSDINNINSWVQTLDTLVKLAEEEFDDIKWLDLGGGLGTLLNDTDFINLNKILNIKKSKFEIWMEPGRYLVSESGVLLSKVTQVRTKNKKNIVGISTGMNSLIRPTLYDAYHSIWNISKLKSNENKYYDIVGPICESGDIIGENRLLPKTEVGDIILIENAGAYGNVMSNSYNMRSPAREEIIRNNISGSLAYNKEHDVFISYL